MALCKLSYPEFWRLKRSRMLAEAKRQREAEAEQVRELEAARLLERRRSYQAELRTIFLDQGLDVEVQVSGKRSDRLKLTFVLFNDVWSHRFQKDGVLATWRDLGFKRIDLTDGYNYHVYWAF